MSCTLFGGSVVALVLVFAASGASAAVVRYAAPGLPTGSAACVDSATPCSLSAALAAAQAGDTVVVTPGTYDFADYGYPQTADEMPITTPSLTIVGGSVAGDPQHKPVFVDLRGLRLQGAGDVLRDIDFDGPNLLVEAPATIDQVRVFTSYDACHIVSNNVLVRDSICHGLEDGVYGEGSNIVLRNVTAVGHATCGVEASGDFPGAYTPPTNSVTMVNTIAHEEKLLVIGTTGMGGSDVCITRVGHPVKVISHNSSYVSLDESGSETELLTLSDGDVLAPPLFVDMNSSDFHEQVLSPTVGAGVVDPANGAMDFDGNSRVSACSGKTDIGAYQWTDSVVCP